jgi:hypothetical protein
LWQADEWMTTEGRESLGSGEHRPRRVLLTGMPGSGKSTLVKELVRTGLQAIDLDEPSWSEYGDLDASTQAKLGTGRRDWVWREQPVAELLESAEADLLFVAGCAPKPGQVLREVRRGRAAHGLRGGDDTAPAQSED